MGKRARFQDHVDPEYQRWGRRYPQFPGVAECMRLIRGGEARGSWADIIAWELETNAAECLPELIGAFRAESRGDVRLYVMMALELARVPASVPFLVEVLRGNDPRSAAYAERTLRAINTRESRTALWEVSQGKAGTDLGHGEQ